MRNKIKTVWFYELIQLMNALLILFGIHPQFSLLRV